MAIRYRSEGFYLSFHLYLSVNVALVNEQANQLCEFGENYFGGSQKWAWLTWLRLAVFLSPVPGVQIVESGEGKKKRRCGAGGRGGERVREGWVYKSIWSLSRRRGGTQQKVFYREPQLRDPRGPCPYLFIHLTAVFWMSRNVPPTLRCNCVTSKNRLRRRISLS